MSTILDALKKSEQERNLNNIPTLSDIPTPQESSRWPMIAFAAAVFVLIAIMIFFAGLWWPQSEQTNAPIVITNETIAASQAQQNKANSDEIVVNVVSYSEQADQRFAMINGKMFREGDFVRGGLRVEEIHPGHVELNLRGRKIVRSP